MVTPVDVLLTGDFSEVSFSVVAFLVTVDSFELLELLVEDEIDELVAEFPQAASDKLASTAIPSAIDFFMIIPPK